MPAPAPAPIVFQPTIVLPEQPPPTVVVNNNLPKPAAKDIRVSFDHGKDGSVSSATGTVTPTE